MLRAPEVNIVVQVMQRLTVVLLVVRERTPIQLVLLHVHPVLTVNLRPLDIQRVLRAPKVNIVDLLNCALLNAMTVMESALDGVLRAIGVVVALRTRKLIVEDVSLVVLLVVPELILI